MVSLASFLLTNRSAWEGSSDVDYGGDSRDGGDGGDGGDAGDGVGWDWTIL